MNKIHGSCSLYSVVLKLQSSDEWEKLQIQTRERIDWTSDLPYKQDRKKHRAKQLVMVHCSSVLPSFVLPSLRSSFLFVPFLSSLQWLVQIKCCCCCDLLPWSLPATNMFTTYRWGKMAPSMNIHYIFCITPLQALWLVEKCSRRNFFITSFTHVLLPHFATEGGVRYLAGIFRTFILNWLPRLPKNLPANLMFICQIIEKTKGINGLFDGEFPVLA